MLFTSEKTSPNLNSTHHRSRTRSTKKPVSPSKPRSCSVSPNVHAHSAMPRKRSNSELSSLEASKALSCQKVSTATVKSKRRHSLSYSKEALNPTTVSSSWGMILQDILHDKNKKAEFTKFLQSRQSVELLDFVLSVDEFVERFGKHKTLGSFLSKLVHSHHHQQQSSASPSLSSPRNKSKFQFLLESPRNEKPELNSSLASLSSQRKNSATTSCSSPDLKKSDSPLPSSPEPLPSWPISPRRIPMSCSASPPFHRNPDLDQENGGGGYTKTDWKRGLRICKRFIGDSAPQRLNITSRVEHKILNAFAKTHVQHMVYKKRGKDYERQLVQEMFEAQSQKKREIHDRYNTTHGGDDNHGDDDCGQGLNSVFIHQGVFDSAYQEVILQLIAQLRDFYHQRWN